MMDEDPLMPRGNSIQNNILIGCKKPFAIARGIKAEWLGRKNNVEWPIENIPIVAGAVAENRLDLARLPELWRKVPGFVPIPVDRIGPDRK
ncbi:MAG TPA: hypothetical protein EYP14_07760 [Planctomycetaceae bacterium]|nr:hypothetical protein [Planctomycetaceae bacterium]